MHELAKDFVMINVYDDDEKGDDPRWQPEGQYIPRIIFYDGLHGEVLKQINEQGNPKFKVWLVVCICVCMNMCACVRVCLSRMILCKGWQGLVPQDINKQGNAQCTA